MTREVEVRAGDCGSVGQKLEPSSLQVREDGLCFRIVCAVAGNVWAIAVVVAVSVSKGGVKKTGVKDWLK